MRGIGFGVLLLLSAAAFAGPTRREIDVVSEAIEAWDTIQAAAKLAPLEASFPGDPDVEFLKARLAFYRAEYAKAVGYLEPVLAASPNDKAALAAQSLFKSTLAALSRRETVTTSKGRFVISYAPGPDEVLIPYLDEALETAYDELGKVFDERPSEPVRVELLERPEQLAAVSPLKASEIKTTGTIALCKYNRLMMVTPRALVYGYPWLDAVVHEYVHLLVTRRSRNTVPVWIHEGLAKYYETRWRDPGPPRLSRQSEDLLSRGLHQKTLIRFEAMSPSIAKLPSAEDAALAYAQVFTVVGMLARSGGEYDVRKLIDAMRSGASDRAALELVTGKNFTRFEREWKNTLFGMNLRVLPAHAEMKLLFKDDEHKDDELESLGEEEARNLTGIADRLAVRKRYGAAAKEYQKALEKAGGANPLVSARLASVLLKLGSPTQVEAVVTPAIEIEPDHVLLYVYRGKARLATGNVEGARRDLELGIRLNPFDPETHGLLAEALTRLGETGAAERERRHHRLVAAPE